MQVVKERERVLRTLVNFVIIHEYELHVAAGDIQIFINDTCIWLFLAKFMNTFILIKKVTCLIQKEETLELRIQNRKLISE